jgi:aspartate kinase
MLVYKFGGTSVGTAERTRIVRDIISGEEQKIVVLSANGKTTDWLVNLISGVQRNDPVLVNQELVRLHQFYENYINDLFQSEKHRLLAAQRINELLSGLDTLLFHLVNDDTKKWVIARGELISSVLFSIYLEESQIDCTELYAPDIIQKSEDGEVDLGITRSRFRQYLSERPDVRVVVTQGFICSNHEGKMDNMGRGGSDYSATIFGYAADAEGIQLWSDVDGFLNNDPGLVHDCIPLDHLSYNEAAELAYFGARILHPRSLFPAQQKNIPLLLKNTLNPQAKGTLISNKTQKGNIKAIAGKDGITSITVHSGRMLLAYGFLKRLFEIFEYLKTPVDMVTTSEVSVSATIDDNTHLNEILSELRNMGEVEVRTNMSIVCVVGDHLTENQGKVSQIFQSLSTIPVRMISYGAGKNSITVLVDMVDKANTLQSLQSLILNHTVQNLSYVL